MADERPPAAIFEGVYFAIIHGGVIDDFKENDLKSKLEENGASHCPLSSTQLRYVTHLIADTVDFPAYNDAVDAYIHVVRPSWVEQSLMRKRASNPRQFSPDPCYFLSDTIIAIAEDIPVHDRDCLIGGIQAMGGQYSPIMTKLVTHVVGLTLESAQCRIIAEKRLKCLAVLPHWLDHCLLLGRKIREDPYKMPNPPILEHDRDGTLKYLKVNKHCGEANIQGASTLEVGSFAIPEPVSPSKTRKALTVFRNHSFLISEDLNINVDLRETLTVLIESGGGKVVPHRDEADAIIVPSRKGLNFQHAVEQRKDVGSLSWLFHLINTNKWTDPMRKLLHYPPLDRGIRGFETFRISVSNYSGEARVYLENLIKAAGGTFTKTLTQDNTHLITAHTLSDKVEAAHEWNIQVVNHLWLEESYGGWTIKSVTEPRYTTFPEKTNLGEIVGQTSIDRSKIEKFMFPNRDLSPTRAGRPEPLQPDAGNVPNPFRTPLASKTNHPTPTTRTPTTNKTHLHDKENEACGSRGAKSRALNKLHSMAPDIALFTKELKRKGGVVYGGRRSNDHDRKDKSSPASARKRSVDDREDGSGDDAEDGAESDPASKRKRTKAGPVTVRLRFMVTSGDRFGWNQDKSEKLGKLGIVQVDDKAQARSADVLVSPKMLRTPKFLAAVAAGLPIVGPGWLDEVMKAGEAVDVEPWLLRDKSSEAELKVNLQQALSRAREHRQHGGLFNGMTIYCTESVEHGVETWERLVSWNGGRLLPYKGRDTKLVDKSNGDQDVETQCFLVTAAKDRRIWKKFRKMASNEGAKSMIVSHEWLIRTCMSQELEVWDPAWEFEA